MRQMLSTGALLAVVLFGTTADAAKKTWHVALDPSQENIAPVVGAHTPTGAGDFTYDDVTKQLCGRITYADLTGPAAGIHIHQAPPGDPTGDGTVKLIVPLGASPVTFNFTLDAAFEASLMSDEVYANVHTAANTKGEIRSYTPWVVSNGPEVPCPGPTNPDGGAGDGGTSSGGDAGTTNDGGSTTGGDGGSTTGGDGGSTGTIPTPTTTSTPTNNGNASSSGSSSSSSGESSVGPAGNIDSESGPPEESEKGGCSTTGLSADPVSLAVVTAIAALVLGVRLRARRRGR